MMCQAMKGGVLLGQNVARIGEQRRDLRLAGSDVRALVFRLIGLRAV